MIIDDVSHELISIIQPVVRSNNFRVTKKTNRRKQRKGGGRPQKGEKDTK